MEGEFWGETVRRKVVASTIVFTHAHISIGSPWNKKSLAGCSCLTATKDGREDSRGFHMYLSACLFRPDFSLKSVFSNSGTKLLQKRKANRYLGSSFVPFHIFPFLLLSQTSAYLNFSIFFLASESDGRCPRLAKCDPLLPVSG